jgi:hypothetical protein
LSRSDSSFTRGCQSVRVARPGFNAGGRVATALVLLFVVGLLAVACPALSHSSVTSVERGSGGSGRAGWITIEAAPLSRFLAMARKFAVCVRHHGIPQLADPRVSANKVILTLPSGLSGSSSRAKRARQACQSTLTPPGASTMPGQGSGPTTRKP